MTFLFGHGSNQSNMPFGGFFSYQPSSVLSALILRKEKETEEVSQEQVPTQPEPKRPVIIC